MRRRLPIPREAINQHVIALGKTGSGKSSKLRVLVEWILDRQEAPLTIIDKKGDWWGLKSSSDGKGPGYPVVIFGGPHADVPLNPRAGAAVAELLVTGNLPSIVDLSDFSVGERTRFFIDFAAPFFKLNRGNRFLVISEVHNFAPQGKILSVEAGEMLHWANTLAAEGRGRGITLLADSQRGQKVHKDFLTSCETLIACRVIHKLDRDAIKDWIDGCAEPDKGREVLSQLASMPRPEAWVWSPEIQFGPERVTFPFFNTFDSFKPQEFRASKQLKGWAEVDLEAVTSKLSSVVEEAKQNDPKELRRRVQELEKQLRTQKPAALPAPVELKAAEERGYKAASAEIMQAWDHARREVLAAIESTFKKHGARSENPNRRQGRPPMAEKVTARAASRARQIDERAPASSADVSKAMPRAMLTTLAQHPDGLTKAQILVHTGYRSSGPVSRTFAELAREGWVEGAGNRLRITPAGLDALGPYEPLPVGDELRAHLLNGSKCSTMEKAMLRTLFDAYPDSMAKGRILELTNYKSSGPVSRSFARLVALGYAQQSGRGELRASDDLFR